MQVPDKDFTSYGCICTCRTNVVPCIVSPVWKRQMQEIKIIYWMKVHRPNCSKSNKLETELGLRILGFVDFKFWWFFFLVFTLKTVFFQSWCLMHSLWVCSNLIFGFRFLSTMMMVLSDFSVQCILCFVSFYQGSYSEW